MASEAIEATKEMLQAALDRLEDANAAYQLAMERAASARSDETAALNRLNKAQAVFDTLAKDVRDRAPRGTDWKRSATEATP
jgi:hypothetical protein